MVKIRPNKPQFLEFEVQRYQQGGRIAYSLVMDLGTLDGEVPQFVSRDRIEKANRKFNDAHSRRIANYIYDIPDWVLGAILLGIDPDAVEFVPYQDDDGQASETLGYIRIPRNKKSSMTILDGQHRRMAIHWMLERLRQEIQAAKVYSSKNSNGRDLMKLRHKFDQLHGMGIPVVLYEEANTNELRQMFADLAKTRNIDATTKTRFDERDPFNRAAVELVEKGLSTLMTNRVEMERTTPLRTSNHLLSVSQLSRCLKVLNYGFGGRASRERLREAEESYDDLIDTGISWADEFLPSARKEYEDLCSVELEEDHIANNRSRYVSFSVPVLEMMAGCFYEWQIRNRQWNELADWLRNADFDVKSEACIFLKSGMLIPGDSALVSRRQNKRATIDFIINQALLANS